MFHKFFSFAAVLLATAVSMASAKTYKLDVDLVVRGHLMTSRIVAREGERTRMQQSRNDEDTFLDVTATRGSDPGSVELDFVIGQFENGKRTVIGTPKIIAHESEAAEMQVGSTQQADPEITLRVIPVSVE